jgi:CheY-like chemotaxis protein
MKPEISPYYYPTNIALVDDNESFLNTLSLHLMQHFSCQTFTNPLDALHYADNLYSVVSSKAAELKTDVDWDRAVFENISSKQFDVKKYNELSVVIVDYDMPEINGIEFCARMKDPSVRKILLTGCASSTDVVTAFNENVIDYYIDKQTDNLLDVLHRTVYEMQKVYFQENLCALTMSLIESKTPCFSDCALADFFDETCDRLDVKEHYFLSGPPRFVLRSSDAESTLIVMSDDDLEQHMTIINEEDGPIEWIEKLASKEYVPHFISEDGFYTPETQGSADPMVKATVICGEQNYYCALIGAEIKPDTAFFFPQDFNTLH